MKKHYKNLVIGFGKGGKTLANWLANSGEEVALVERSTAMYGGSCINIACIPTKSLIASAEKGIPFAEALLQKNLLTATLRKQNFEKIASLPNATIIDGTASFISAHQIKVRTSGHETTLSADRIFINTGTRPRRPDIPGVDSKHIYDSTSLMQIDDVPKHLAIIGGGFVGLEFADMFLKFGARVTLLIRNTRFLPNEDSDISGSIYDTLGRRGLQLVAGATIEGFSESPDSVSITYEQNGHQHQLTADAVLLATGREPVTEQLNLGAAGIATDEHGFIRVNDRLQTTAADVWAIGDVNGGPKFTYISLDDCRIIQNQLEGGTYTSLDKRDTFATSVFINPPLAKVGLTATEASEKGLNYRVYTLPAANIPKAAILGQQNGLLKAVVDTVSGKIIGCTLFCAEAHELINIVQLAINTGTPYNVLRDAIYTHPSMAEGLNDLFASPKE